MFTTPAHNGHSCGKPGDSLHHDEGAAFVFNTGRLVTDKATTN